MESRILPYTQLPERRQILPPQHGRMVRVEKNTYTDASRILGIVINEKDPRFVSVHRQISNGAIMETNIKGKLKTIANKISLAKTTSGKAIDLFPLRERIADYLKGILKAIR